MTVLLSYYFVVACMMSNELNINISIRTHGDSKITRLWAEVQY
jgi:hypothetical protein